MKVLLDHCMPRRFAHLLPRHEVTTAFDHGWDRLRNGVLLAASANAGYDVVVTVDRRMKHEQNLETLPIAVIVICAGSNDFEVLTRMAPTVCAALERVRPRELIEVT